MILIFGKTGQLDVNWPAMRQTLVFLAEIRQI